MDFLSSEITSLKESLKDVTKKTSGTQNYLISFNQKIQDLEKISQPLSTTFEEFSKIGTDLDNRINKAEQLIDNKYLDLNKSLEALTMEFKNSPSQENIGGQKYEGLITRIENLKKVVDSLKPLSGKIEKIESDLSKLTSAPELN